jgi:hypothetical protein
MVHVGDYERALVDRGSERKSTVVGYLLVTLKGHLTGPGV